MIPFADAAAVMTSDQQYLDLAAGDRLHARKLPRP